MTLNIIVTNWRKNNFDKKIERNTFKLKKTKIQIGLYCCLLLDIIIVSLNSNHMTDRIILLDFHYIGKYYFEILITLIKFVKYFNFFCAYCVRARLNLVEIQLSLSTATKIFVGCEFVINKCLELIFPSNQSIWWIKFEVLFKWKSALNYGFMALNRRHIETMYFFVQQIIKIL